MREAASSLIQSAPLTVHTSLLPTVPRFLALCTLSFPWQRPVTSSGL